MKPAIPERYTTNKIASSLFLRRLFGIGWLVVLITGICILGWYIVQVSQGTTDFCQDYLAAQYLAQGKSPYAPLQCVGLRPYNAHPPFSVLLFFPLGLLPKLSAFILWGMISLVAYLIAGAILLWALGWLTRRSMALFVIGSIFWAPFVIAVNTQNLGQLVTLLIIAAWFLERRNSGILAGGVIGLAGLLKIWPIVLLVDAAFRRQWRVLIAGGLTLILGVLISLLILGPETFLAYLGPVQMEERSEIPAKPNTSLVGGITRFFIGYPDRPPMPPASTVLTLEQASFIGEGIGVLVLLSAIALIWKCYQRSQTEEVINLSQGLLVTVLLLVFPITWYWGLITLLFPVTMLLLACRTMPGLPSRWWLLLCISLFPLLIPSWILVAIPGWILVSWGNNVSVLANLLTNLSTCMLLLFASVQVWLLLRATKITHDDHKDSLAIRDLEV